MFGSFFVLLCKTGPTAYILTVVCTFHTRLAYIHTVYKYQCLFYSVINYIVYILLCSDTTKYHPHETRDTS